MWATAETALLITVSVVLGKYRQILIPLYWTYPNLFRSLNLGFGKKERPPLKASKMMHIVEF